MSDHEGDPVAEARVRAGAIIAAAQAEAAALLEEAEVKARERADVVVAEFQERIDRLLVEEAAARARLSELGVMPAEVTASRSDIVDDRDAVSGIEVIADSSLAEYMKVTLRHEVRPE